MEQTGGGRFLIVGCSIARAVTFANLYAFNTDRGPSVSSAAAKSSETNLMYVDAFALSARASLSLWEPFQPPPDQGGSIALPPAEAIGQLRNPAPSSQDECSSVLVFG